MVIVRTIDYPAFTGNEERRLYIYLPTEYEEDENRHYPVLYMFDGHNVFFDDDATFGKSWGLGTYLDYIDAPLIVAALECHHGENNERLSEYSPYDFTQKNFGKITGYGRETMEFLIHELKPTVDGEFRTIPDRSHTFIAGSSMGGLMAMYAALEYNRYFSRAACLSPSIFLCYSRMKELAKKAQMGATVVYMDVGTKEIGPRGIRLFGDFAQTLMQKGIAVTARVVPGGRHSEASWERQIPFFIEALLYGRNF